MPGVHFRSRRSRGRACKQVGAVTSSPSKLRFTLPIGFGCLDVRDFASGVVLAAERGRSGQRYLLSGENVTTNQLLEQAAAIAGVRAPQFAPPMRARARAGRRCSRWSARFAENRLLLPARSFRSSGATPGTTPRRLEPSSDGRRGRCARRSTDTIRWLQNPQSSCRRIACTGARGCRAMRRLIIVLVLALIVGGWWVIAAPRPEIQIADPFRSIAATEAGDSSGRSIRRVRRELSSSFRPRCPPSTMRCSCRTARPRSSRRSTARSGG